MWYAKKIITTKCVSSLGGYGCKLLNISKTTRGGYDTFLATGRGENRFLGGIVNRIGKEEK